MTYESKAGREIEGTGRLTAEALARIDELRMRISGGKRLNTDSAEIIREEREKRTRQIERALRGDWDDEEREEREA